MNQKDIWKKVKALGGWMISKINFVLFITSVIIAVAFLAAPPLLKCCSCFYSFIDSFLEGLKYSEYKEAYIGASGGMIGSFLAITGAVWIEKKLLRHSEKKEIEKLATILYYDIEFFYGDISSLVKEIGKILEKANDKQKMKKYTICKTPIGIYIYSDWIALVASLKDVLDKEEIKKIYDFYGNVSNIKSLIQKDSIAVEHIEDIAQALNKVGLKEEDQYLPNEEYKKILNHLKKIAKI